MAGVLSRSSILSPVGRITLSLRGDGGTALALRVKPTRRVSRSVQGGSWRSENIGADPLVPGSDMGRQRSVWPR